MKSTIILAIVFFCMLVNAKPLNRRSIKACYKNAKLTQYWIPKEGDKDMLNDGQVVTLSGSKTSTLKTTSGSTIAKVSKTTYEVNNNKNQGCKKNTN